MAPRWLLHAGGMSPISLDEPPGRYLSFAEREDIALLRAQEVAVREIARRIGRDPGAVSRELRRNAATRGDKPGLPGCSSAVEGPASGKAAGRMAIDFHWLRSVIGGWMSQETFAVRVSESGPTQKPRPSTRVGQEISQ